MRMDERTIFEYVDQQNRLWKKGLYDYLDNSILSIRFDMCKYFIEKEFTQNIDVLEIGAGSGKMLTLISDKIKSYVFNDVSEEAVKLFKSNCNEIIKEKNVEILFGNISDFELNKKFDVILVLGVLRYNFYVDMFKDLYFKHLNKGGILIMESNVGCYVRNHYCSELPQPSYSLEFKLEDYVDSSMPKNRIIDVFKYK